MRHLIVAHYNESLAWLEQVMRLRDPWSITVITNGHHRTNVGREAGAYMHYIAMNYDRLNPDDIYAFVQAEPFAHSPALLKLIELDCTQWHALGGYEFHTDANGAPDHPGLGVGEWYESLIGEPFPAAGLDPHAGAQFIMSGRVILDHPCSFYFDLLDRMTYDPLAPWVLERLWAVIFR